MTEASDSPETLPSDENLSNDSQAAQVDTKDVKPRWLPELPQSKKIAHFAAGFLGWFLGFGLIWLIGLNLPLDEYTFVFMPLCLLPINLIVLLILANARSDRWIALGLLSAWAANLGLSLLLGLAMNAACLIPFFVGQ